MKKAIASGHVRHLRVVLVSTPVGEMLLARDGKIWFQYVADWLSTGFNLSPFMNFDARAQLAKDSLFEGLHGVFADSLPDGWGLLLMDREFKRRFRMVKFRSQDDPADMGRIEQAYAEMAREAGVAMPASATTVYSKPCAWSPAITPKLSMHSA